MTYAAVGGERPLSVIKKSVRDSGTVASGSFSIRSGAFANRPPASLGDILLNSLY